MYNNNNIITTVQYRKDTAHVEAVLIVWLVYCDVWAADEQVVQGLRWDGV